MASPASRSGSLRQFWLLIRGYWWSEDKRPARALLFGIVVLALGMVYMNVQINRWQNAFFSALQAKDESALYWQLLRFLLLAAVLVAMSVYAQYFTQMLQIRWRRWLTDRYLRDWLGDRAYYRMQFAEQETDNPDQRIAEDLKAFVEQTTTLFLGLLNASVTLVSFIGILWTLSGTLTVHIGAASLSVPGYVVWAAVAYALVGNWCAHIIGKPLAALNFAREHVEADFRYNLVRFRESMDGVALGGGETSELNGFRARFAGILANWLAIMRRQKQLNWFTSGYGQLSVVVPFAVAAPRFFSGAIGLGDLMQTAGAFGYVRDSLSWFISAYVTFASWKAAADRLVTFQQAIEAAKTEQQSNTGVQVRDDANGKLTFEHVELDLPGGAPLTATANLEITAGSRQLIQGPSGSGKSTLLRAVAGIWPFGRGVIHRPARFDALFVPQRPYFPLGSLRHAVSYPASATTFTDAEIQDALMQVGLAHVGSRLNETANWSAELSGADQQRVAFARAILHRPSWLFLDEATSDLDDDSRSALYSLLAQRLPNATVVSIAGREALTRYHTRTWELRKRSGGRYELSELDPRVA